MSNNVVALSSESERRRRNPFGGYGKHRRTPEAWAQKERELAAALAEAAQAKRDLEWARRDVDALKGQVNEMGGELRRLLGEVSQMRALMSADAHSQDTVTIIPPSQDFEETQPIEQAELFAEDPIASVVPKIRVGDIKPPDASTSDAATQLLDRLSSQGSEPVTQVVPLWGAPQSGSFRVERRHTA